MRARDHRGSADIPLFNPWPPVFLSHSGADTAAARGFARLLRRNGVDVWLDRDSLQPGDRWMETVEEVIGQSSALVV
jgi:hypothetical protein